MTPTEILEMTNSFQQAKKLFTLITNSSSISKIDMEKQIIKSMIDKFLNTKISKTDFNLLIELQNHLIVEESIIRFKNYDALSIKLSRGNIARSLKALDENGFITKLTNNKGLNYFFNIQYKVMLDFNEK